ncbi:hypothetical protein PF002_g1141 [Phytophthora fragariae]|uniref:Uncharacterized protein n=1 Tax=Phytophthora fragariae TaxID=53985 RepID=A0A6A4AI30_9STRA|nr:hypothetical protein PF002_g1141 [Phytophthora fragariae]
MGLIQAPPGSRADHCSTATMTGSSSIAGVDASPAWKPSWPLQHRHHDRQQLQQQQHCRGRCKPRLEAELPAAAALPGSMQAPPGSRAGHCSTATMTSNGGGSSSSISIAGRCTVRWSWCKPPPGRTPS